VKERKRYPLRGEIPPWIPDVAARADIFLAAPKRLPDKRVMHTSSLPKRLAITLSAVALLTTSLVAAENPFLGRWALTIPGGGAGWLGVAEEGGQLKGSILWGGGSVVPVTSTKVEGDTLIVRA